MPITGSAPVQRNITHCEHNENIRIADFIRGAQQTARVFARTAEGAGAAG